MSSFFSFLSRCVVWLRRFRYRRGYGVHSPFAFNYIRDVIFGQGEYYAYDTLRIKRYEHLRPERDLQLFFRVANAHRTASATIRVDDKCNDSTDVVAYLRAARSKMMFYGTDTFVAHTAPHLVVSLGRFWFLDVRNALPHATPETLFLVGPITGQLAKEWQKLCDDPRTFVCFDLHDFGIAFCNPEYLAQTYKVNRAF